MRQVLYIYKLVEWTNQKMADDEQYRPDVITISYDEKPGVQALGGTVEDFTPIPGKYKTVQRDYEYVRHGAVSLLAGALIFTMAPLQPWYGTATSPAIS
jgi:hypothetical protein